jgi:hypothetical protein
MSQAVVSGLAMIQARYEGHPFLDYYDCLQASLEAARNRSKLAVRATLAGDAVAAERHRGLRDDYMRRVRQWHSMIDWSAADAA